MLAPWENTYRISAAKKLLTDIVDSLKVDKSLELALRVYGHQFHRRFQNCQDTKLEVPFAPENHERIKDRLASITPQGTTPIAYSLMQSANDFPPDGQARNVIIIITDGIESCEGDPCDVSLALQRQNVFLKPFIIGIGMNETFEAQFKCVGDFFDADNISGFKRALNQVIRQSLERATVSVELLDINDQPTETNVNVTFINNFTKEAAYEFVHFLDRQGRPDSVEVDPILTYDVVVNTIPPVVKPNVEIAGGRHNIIRIKSPQGYIKINQKGYTEYQKGVKALIRKKGVTGNIHVMEMPSSEKVLVGDYELEFLTTPRRIIPVTIQPDQISQVDLPAPGVLNIVTSVSGYGSLYQMGEGAQTWVKNLNHDVNSTTMAIQPGKYKIVFRSRNSLGSKYTQIKQFEIKSGATMNVRFTF